MQGEDTAYQDGTVFAEGRSSSATSGDTYRQDIGQALLLAGNVCVIARTGGGKTEYLVRKAAELLDSEAPAEGGGAPATHRVLVMAATRQAATAFSRRLARLLGIREDDLMARPSIRVTTPRQIAAGLCTDHGRSAVAPYAVVATRAECDCIRADLAAERACHRGASNDEGTSADREEVVRRLRQMGRIHPDDVIPTACRAFGDRDAEDMTLQCWQYVLVDDVHRCPAGTLELAYNLAERGLYATVGEDSASSVATDAVSWDAVVRLAPDGESSEARRRIRAFAHAAAIRDSREYDDAVQEGMLDADDAHVVVVKAKTPNQEIAELPALMRRIFSQSGDLRPCDVCLTVPNRTWAKAARRSLESVDVHSTVALAQDPLTPYDNMAEVREALEAVARLSLMAHPEDVMSWRLWIAAGAPQAGASWWVACGDWLASQVDSALPRRTLTRQDIELMASMPDDFCTGAERITERLQVGMELVERSELVGFSLAAACNPRDNALFTELTGVVDPEEDAESLYARVRANCMDPTFDPDTDLVRICSPEQLVGQSPRVVVMLGLVEGLVPKSEATADVERKVFAEAAGKPSDLLILSTFQEAEQRVAQALRLMVRRSKMEQGTRMAMLARSRFIDDAQNAAPGTVGAAQYLS